jgi:hypothetical protein
MSMFMLQVKELLDRNLKANEIAQRLCLDFERVQSAVTMLVDRKRKRIDGGVV